MSDWDTAPPDPTIMVNFPWADRPHVNCANCYAYLSDVSARSCWAGCGIVFQFITTAATDEHWKRHVRMLRTDLIERHWEAKVEPTTPVTYAKGMPITPMKAHDRGNPAGEGQAGAYVRELRSKRKALGFDQRAGSGWYFDPKRKTYYEKKEEPMKPTVNVEIEFDTYANLIHALLELSKAEGLSGINVTDKVGANEAVADTLSERYAPVALTRRYIDEKPLIREYLAKVCARPEGVMRPTVTITYVAEGTKERTTRVAIPYRIEPREQNHWPYGQRDYLVLKDVKKDAMRSFLLDNIISVEGEAV